MPDPVESLDDQGDTIMSRYHPSPGQEQVRWGIDHDTFDWDSVVDSDVHDVSTLLPHRLSTMWFHKPGFATETEYYEWEMGSETDTIKDVGYVVDCLVGLVILGL